MDIIDEGVWYQSANSSIWYSLLGDAGTICAIRTDGVTEYVGEEAAVTIEHLQEQTHKQYLELNETKCLLRSVDKKLSMANAENEVLRSVFKHIHINNGENDSCFKCGLDIRNQIHARINHEQTIT